MTEPNRAASDVAPTTMLDLGEARPIATGTYREVYVFPGRADLVVKVLMPGAAVQPGKPIRAFLKSRSARHLYRFMFREYEAYLECRLAPAASRVPFPIAHLCWLQDTSRGLGMVAERVRGSSDGPARSLATLQAEGGVGDAELDALNRFIEALIALDVVTNDTNPNNVLLDETGPDLRFVLVDGFGDTHPLGLKKRFAGLRRDQRNRRFAGMARFLGLHWDEERSRIRRP